ncbi:hypothetical protein [Nocardia sp. NPDC005366]|uniref:hypothetical protein n=1 Tax=Nocardia sp. NPDC005366 TaxID=3156878 RepID=UPI0033B1555B
MTTEIRYRALDITWIDRTRRTPLETLPRAEFGEYLGLAALVTGAHRAAARIPRAPTDQFTSGTR